MSDTAAQPGPDDHLFVDNSDQLHNPATEHTKVNHLLYDGNAGAIFKIWLLNFFMNIITLGIYSFWGKTRLRRYVVSAFSLDNDRFEYTGSGAELLKGFIKAVPLLLLIYGPFFIAPFFLPEDSPVQFLVIIPIFFFIPVAIYSATRYRISRTNWRGIRGALDGSAFAYGLFSVWRTFLNIISLGLLIPSSDIERHRYMINRMYFGNVPLEFHGTSGKLMGVHIITLILAPFTLGISRFWYWAAAGREKVNGVVAGDIKFRNDMTGGDLFGLHFINIILMIMTAGLAKAIVVQRKMQFFARHNFVGGDLKTSQIQQSTRQKAGVGEGLDDALDLDTGLF